MNKKIIVKFVFIPSSFSLPLLDCDVGGAAGKTMFLAWLFIIGILLTLGCSNVPGTFKLFWGIGVKDIFRLFIGTGANDLSELVKGQDDTDLFGGIGVIDLFKLCRDGPGVNDMLKLFDRPGDADLFGLFDGLGVYDLFELLDGQGVTDLFGLFDGQDVTDLFGLLDCQGVTDLFELKLSAYSEELKIGYKNI